MADDPRHFPDPREAWSSPYRGVEIGWSLRWLAGGAMLYAVLLLVCMAGNPREATWPVVGPSLYLTPMFGLPFVLATVNRPGRTRRLVYFIGLLPLIHVAANYAAFNVYASYFDLAEPGRDLILDTIAGAVGGALGSSLAFAALHLIRLTTPRRRHLWWMAAAVVLLAALGGVGMGAGLKLTDALVQTQDPGRAIVWFQIVHLPWQMLFALWLAWLMRKPRVPRKRDRAPLPAEPVERG